MTDQPEPYDFHDEAERALLNDNLAPGEQASLHALLAIHDTLTEIRDRLPKPEGVNPVEDEPTDITEEPPVGSQVTDCEGDVWERREGGWALWCAERPGWLAEGELDPWPDVRSTAPLRPTTDEDRVRVGLPLRPGTCDGCGNPIPVARCVCATCDHDNSTKPADADREHWLTSTPEEREHAASERTAAPADVDPDEAIAEVLHGADSSGHFSWEGTGLEARADYLRMARAAREHIEQEIPEELDKIGITWQSRARRMGKRAEEAEADVERLTRERDDLTEAIAALAEQIPIIGPAMAERHRRRMREARAEEAQWITQRIAQVDPDLGARMAEIDEETR